MQHPQNPSSSSSPFAYSDKPQLGLDVDFGADPASGTFFQTDGRKHDDLKQMLDSSKDGLKLEAMKRIIGMIARGRDASDLFAAVVKNVVSKNIEVKKLVYVYLVRYAEEQQDLALLSISTFQRALKDPNQLIRASALRVLSSIRVNMIVPIVMLAIRDSAADMSAYVRKTAAHAIPKLYSLDADQKDELVMVIEKLLSDRTTLVVGSAVMAFDEVCPERIDLIHKNYRKLCNLLVDVDEWGQVIIINMLTRYARSQFINPNIDESPDNYIDSKHFYDDSNTSGLSDTEQSHAHSKNRFSTYHIDSDHRLLLRQSKPLLQSRNASVVMAVSQLYYHIAPQAEVHLVAKALIRLLRSHKEVQSVVLTCIASMSSKKKGIFEPYIKTFFVRTSDPTHIKLLKLDILTNLAAASTISLILREFQTYISSNDRYFVAATIQAIGRCAASIKEVTENCLSGLVHLLSNRDEHVVAESVIVIKKLLQTKVAEHFEIISQMAKLLDYIMVPAARASIIWLIGEYNEKVPKIAPDVLRKMAKTFIDEEDDVKLQVLNLGVKLFVTNSESTSLLCQYVFTLARYDPNYDVRDRARFLRQLIFPACRNSSFLAPYARKIFLSSKPAPVLESKYRDRDHFQLGSLSHYLNMCANGYTDLPSFPDEAPDSSVRNIDGYMIDSITNATGINVIGKAIEEHSNCNEKKKPLKNDANFFEESETSSSYSDTSTSSDDEVSNEFKLDAQIKPELRNPSNKQEKLLSEVIESNDLLNENITSNESSCTTSNIDSENDSYSNDSSEESSSNDDIAKEQAQNIKPKKEEVNKKTALSSLDLLLEIDDVSLMGPVMTPSLGGFLSPDTPILSSIAGSCTQDSANQVELVGPSFIEFKHKELLNKLSGHGLQVNYRFTRAPHLISSKMVSIELQFVNNLGTEIVGIKISQTAFPKDIHLYEFTPIQKLAPRQIVTGTLGVDFNDSTHSIEFEITSSVGTSDLIIKPPIGELVRSVHIHEYYFKKERTKLRGMNEHKTQLSLQQDLLDMAAVKQKIYECINVACIPISAPVTPYNVLYFAGETVSSKSLVLITLDWSLRNGAELTLTVNCEKMIIGSMVLNEIRNAFSVTFK